LEFGALEGLARKGRTIVSIDVRGIGALWVLFAAALDVRIRSTIREGGLLPYRTLISSDRYLHGADIFIPDVLKYFDLPNVAAALDGRVAVIAPVGAMKNPVEPSRARKVYSPPVRCGP
jgi:hypothetical protein